MEQERITYLLNGYLQNTLTPLETEELQQLMLEDETAPRVSASFQHIINSQQPDASYNPAQWESVVDHILYNKGTARVRRLFIRRVMAVAALFICMGLGAYLWLQSTHGNRQHTARQNKYPGITPGRNGAVLTLADGTQVELDSLGNALVATQKGTDIRMENGQLSYIASAQATNQPVYNTISTPKGRQFHITLADGTGVWLNAATTMRFPASFTGAERKVEVNGEAYFEVAQNAAMPFRVIVKEAGEINVLGTHFNVNDYNDEPDTKVTLLEGAVKVNKGGQSSVLQPGQQAQVTKTINVTSGVDLDRVVAWKNGTFSFGKEVSLAEMMRQIARWYDIEVKYEGAVPQREFGGKIHRTADIGAVLEVLEESGIRYRLNNKELMILP